MVGGTYVKGFNRTEDALQWTKKHGVKLDPKQIPLDIVKCEPILSEPTVVMHRNPLVEKGVARIFTDGSCLSNPGGPGGFASVALLPDGSEIILSGREASTTNNRMELMAALSILNYLDSRRASGDKINYTIYTDSQYLRDMFEKGWIEKWELTGWKTSLGKKVQNKDIIEMLNWLVGSMGVRFSWVKSHNGNCYNEKADKVAVTEAQKAAEECGFTVPSDYNRGIGYKSYKEREKTKPIISTTVAKSRCIKEQNAAVVNTTQTAKTQISPQEKKADETGNAVFVAAEAFEPKFRMMHVGKQKRSGNKREKFDKSIRKVLLRAELANGDILMLPASLKQSEVITRILGLVVQQDDLNIKAFDDTTLEEMMTMQTNPFVVSAQKK